MSNIAEKIPAIIWVEPDISPLGFRSKLREEIDGKTVFQRTLERINQAKNISKIILYTSHTNYEVVKELSSGFDVEIIEADINIPIWFSAIVSGRKWALTSWRGGVLNTCVFDEIIIPPILLKVFEQLETDIGIVVSDHSALIDPEILDKQVEQANKYEEYKLFFTQAPPGLSGTIIKKDLLEKMSQAAIHVGRAVGYDPIAPKPDLIDRPCNLKLNHTIITTPIRFICDTQRSIELIRKLAEKIDIEKANAEEIAQLSMQIRDSQPKEIELEISSSWRWKNILRKPINNPLSIEEGLELVENLATKYDDILVFIGGNGEPTLNDSFDDVIKKLKSLGTYGISIHTDGLFEQDKIHALLNLPIDIINVLVEVPERNLYSKLLGLDAYDKVISNINEMIKIKSERKVFVPLIVPEMLKLPDTLELMDEFYDGWFRRVGWAVIRGVIPEF